MNTETPAPLLPCPFCGWEPPFTDPDQMLDVLYPSGVWWRVETVNGREVCSFVTHRERKAGDQKCWEMNCTENMGGCGASIHGMTVDDTVRKWNTRA